MHVLTQVCMFIQKIFIITHVANSTECRPDIDEEWGIQWQLTNAGSVAVGQCHSGSGSVHKY